MDSPRAGEAAGQGGNAIVEKVDTLDAHGDAKGKMGRFEELKKRHIVEEPYLGPPNEELGEVDITTGQKMLSAVSGSLFTSLIVTPLDVVRVRLQSQPKPPALSVLAEIAKTAPSVTGGGTLTLPQNLGVTACCREVFFMGNSTSSICLAGPDIGLMRSASGSIAGTCAVEETERKTFNSTIDAFRKIARNEGVTTLWRGLSPTLVMTVPANIIYFTGYDWLRFHPRSPINQLFSANYSPLIAGSFARIVAAIVVSPIEMFRTRMQASHGETTQGHFMKTFEGLRKMTRRHGYSSLWRGLTLTLWRDVPFSGLYWWGYETVRGRLTDARERSRGREIERGSARAEQRTRSQSREDHTATFTDSFTAGAMSGAVASILTMPFDVGKTRQQVFKDRRAGGVATNGLAPEQLSMPKFLMHIFKEEGVAGLWRGWVARTLKVAPACAIMISCYEVGKRMSRSFNEKAKEKALREL